MKTILVVDDFPNTLKVVEFTVKRLNDIKLLTASNGLEALKHFNGQKIDLLITDLNMPEMNGIELVDEVRKLHDYAYMPIIMLTTETSEEKRTEAKKVAVTAWMQKPFKAEKFLEVVKRLLGSNLS